jgi:hypothetical protein
VVRFHWPTFAFKLSSLWSLRLIRRSCQPTLNPKICLFMTIDLCRCFYEQSGRSSCLCRPRPAHHIVSGTYLPFHPSMHPIPSLLLSSPASLLRLQTLFDFHSLPVIISRHCLASTLHLPAQTILSLRSMPSLSIYLRFPSRSAICSCSPIQLIFFSRPDLSRLSEAHTLDPSQNNFRLFVFAR